MGSDISQFGPTAHSVGEEFKRLGEQVNAMWAAIAPVIRRIGRMLRNRIPRGFPRHRVGGKSIKWNCDHRLRMRRRGVIVLVRHDL